MQLFKQLFPFFLSHHRRICNSTLIMNIVIYQPVAFFKVFLARNKVSLERTKHSCIVLNNDIKLLLFH